MNDNYARRWTNDDLRGQYRRMSFGQYHAILLSAEY